MKRTMFALVLGVLSSSNAFAAGTEFMDYLQQHQAVTLASASCRTTQVYGQYDMASGNCAILGGTLGRCTLANARTGYFVCSCTICN